MRNSLSDKKCFIIIIALSLWIGLAQVGWAEEMIACPQTDYPLGPPDKEVKGFESGKIIAEPDGITASAFCRYDDGKYELFLHWRKLEEPPQKEKIPCHNDTSFYDSDSGGEESVREIETYMSYVGFGLDTREENGKFYIDYAEEYSPAFDANLSEYRGAQILQVNGESIEGKNIRDVYKLLTRDYNTEAQPGELLTLKIQLPESEDIKDVELHAALFDPLVGSEIYVYSRTHFARVEVRVDPHQPITQEMKDYWVAKAKELLKQTEPLTQECQ